MESLGRKEANFVRKISKKKNFSDFSGVGCSIYNSSDFWPIENSALDPQKSQLNKFYNFWTNLVKKKFSHKNAKGDRREIFGKKK